MYINEITQGISKKKIEKLTDLYYTLKAHSVVKC